MCQQTNAAATEFRKSPTVNTHTAEMTNNQKHQNEYCPEHKAEMTNDHKSNFSEYLSIM